GRAMRPARVFADEGDAMDAWPGARWLARLRHCLTRPKPGQHRPDRPENDQYVEPGREIFDVVEVVLKLGMDLVDARHMALVDLRPTADSGPHYVAIAIEGNFPRVI